jgi:hypothetical protein
MRTGGGGGGGQEHVECSTFSARLRKIVCCKLICAQLLLADKDGK